eukprot:SAG31_NODE_28250_length_413_cov_0.700637_1_plen_65_part_01
MSGIVNLREKKKGRTTCFLVGYIMVATRRKGNKSRATNARAYTEKHKLINICIRMAGISIYEGQI